MATPEKPKERAPRPGSKKWYIEAARDVHQREGACEIDDNAVVSYSDDGGAYVQAWIWVYGEPKPEPRKKKDKPSVPTA